MRNKLVPFTHEIDGITYNLRPLSGIQALEVSDYVVVLEDGGVSIPAKSCNAAIKYGVEGWDFKEDGEAVPFNIDRLYFNEIKLLATAIIGRSELTSEDTKK